MRVSTQEDEIERYFKKRCMIELRGHCLKFVSPGNDGVPDRIILVPGGIVAFAELKAPGKKPRPSQKHWLKSLDRMGFLTYVIDTKVKANLAIKELKAFQDAVQEQLEEGGDAQ